MGKDSIIRIYAAAMCFFTGAVGIVTTAIALYAGLEAAVPELLIPGTIYEAHQSNDAYRRWREHGQQYSLKPVEVKLPAGEGELTKMREAAFQSLIAANKRDGLQSLLRCVILALFCALLFWGHWRMLHRQARE